jgi:hypothetical protein
MGAVLSTVLLLGAAVGLGASSVYEAHTVHTSAPDRWTKVGVASIITATTAVLVTVLALFIIIKARSSAEVGLLGVHIALIMLLVAMMAIAGIQFLSLYDATKTDANAFRLNVISAAIAFGVVIAALSVIIFMV